MVQQPPCPELSEFVESVWATDGMSRLSDGRVRVLPIGALHIVFRLSNAPIRIFADERDACGFDGGFAVVNGFRSGHYVRGMVAATRSVGATLRFGAIPRLFGCGQMNWWRSTRDWTNSGQATLTTVSIDSWKRRPTDN